MKKQDFYINTIGGMDNIDYPKVSGYVEEIEDSDGNKTKIGYNKKGKEKGKNCWTATELTTGFKCSLGNFETKAKCVEWVHNNIDIISKIKRDKMNGNYRERFIQPFINYVEANS